MQKQIFRQKDEELTKEEYFRLLKAAEDKPWLQMILQTIGSTGIRVSELRFFTVESLQTGEISVSCKNKTRLVLMPNDLRDLLLDYCKKRGLTSGVIFRTRNGNPLDRSNIWSAMKKLGEKAGVEESKIFPHSLRRLFAREFHARKNDLAMLADVLGHSNINTTRIYIMTTAENHRGVLEGLGLLLPGSVGEKCATVYSPNREMKTAAKFGNPFQDIPMAGQYWLNWHAVPESGAGLIHRRQQTKIPHKRPYVVVNSYIPSEWGKNIRFPSMK